jgi:hypothetical protein
MLPGFDEARLPWIRVNDSLDVLGVSPQDVFEVFYKKKIPTEKLIGTTAIELRLAFANANLRTTTLHKLTEVYLYGPQLDFFEKSIGRPDLIIG